MRVGCKGRETIKLCKSCSLLSQRLSPTWEQGLGERKGSLWVETEAMLILSINK